MEHERLITGVAAVFAAIAIVLAVTSLITNPAVFPVSLAFAAAAYLMYDQISGRMAARVYERVERRARVDGTGRVRSRRSDGGGRGASGGFGAGPREQWEPPRGGRTAREAAVGAGPRRAPGGQRRAAPQRTRPGPSPADRAAYETLGIDPGADEATIKRAYRERVKEVHPDATDGDREQFTAVKDAYEQLTD